MIPVTRKEWKSSGLPIGFTLFGSTTACFAGNELRSSLGIVTVLVLVPAIRKLRKRIEIGKSGELTKSDGDYRRRERVIYCPLTAD